MSKQNTIRFSAEQVEYLMKKTGASTPQEAVDTFALIIRNENIDPTDMMLYLKRLMEKDGVR